MKNLIKLIVLVLLPAVTGCQLLATEPYESYSDAKYAMYYLKTKQLSHADLVLEIDAQKHFQEMGIDDADLKLTLLYSLPNAPIHNPYNAKSRLNEYGLPLESKWLLSKEDVAFFTMLRDQLNEQLLILEQLSEKEKKHNQEKRTLIKLRNHIAKLELNNIEKNNKDKCST